MPTNALGSGTKNFTVNMPEEEHSAWGRIAFLARAKSSGAFLREMALKGLEAHNKEAAEAIAKIRKQRLALVMLIVGAPLILAAQFCHNDLRRVRVSQEVAEVTEIAEVA